MAGAGLPLAGGGGGPRPPAPGGGPWFHFKKRKEN